MGLLDQLEESGHIISVDLDGQFFSEKRRKEVERLRDWSRQQVKFKRRELDEAKEKVKECEDWLVLLAELKMWQRNSRYYDWGDHCHLLAKAEIVEKDGQIVVEDWQNAILQEWLDKSGGKLPKGFVVLASVDEAVKVKCPNCGHEHLLIFESRKYRDSPEGDSSGWEFNVYCGVKKINLYCKIFEH